MSNSEQSDYTLGPDSTRQPGVPTGTVTKHTIESAIFPGTIRDYYIYVPAQYDGSRAASLMVFQDGESYVNEEKYVRAPIVFDNLIAQGAMPVTIGLFIQPGVFVTPTKEGQEPIRNRSFEYDTLSDQYARFIIEEMIPLLATQYKISDDPAQRAICGMSSGGICAWTVAWERPDAFRKVLSHCGSFTDIRGGGIYGTLIRQTPKKPIRIFLQSGEQDLDRPAGNWPLANKLMASALNFSGYEYQFVFGTEGHTLRHGGAIFPESLRWLWRQEE